MNVTVVGNLCADPEVRETKRGLALADLRVAVNRNVHIQDDEWRQETSFYTVVCWQGLAERVAESLHRGDRVVIVGRMSQEGWTTDTGESKSRYVITADDVAASVRFATVEIHKPPRSESHQPTDHAADGPERRVESPA